MKVKVQHDQAFGSHPRQRLDTYDPGKPGAPVVMFIHGGSWQRGSKMMYRFVGRALAAMGYVAVLPGYRMYPEVKFPAFVEDGALAVKWVHERFPNRKLFIAGHSAGALNAALLTYDPKYLKRVGLSGDLITGFIGLSGPYDFYPRPGLQPIFNLPSADRSWLPVANIKTSVPALLLHGAWDITVIPKNSRSMAAALEQHGIRADLHIYRFMDHMWLVIALLPVVRWFAPAYRDIKRFLGSHS